jgi:hypothetical protein
MTQPSAGFGFLPWLRTGLAGEISRADGDPSAQPRASVQVTVVIDAVGQPRPVPVTLPLVGPGEVGALDPRAVIRTAPVAGVLDAEPHELPLVEFAEPDLPWRYTPATAAPDGRLRPWLVLAVLRTDEITADDPAGSDGRLPAITVSSASALPRLDQSWAWAHVQVDGFQPATEDLATVDPRRVRARLLAARHLAPRTGYVAVLVPAFERGRLAGLREPVPDSVDGLASAWSPAATAIRLPVYHRWSFQTGEQADFEQLARRLVGRPADATVGTYPLDVSAPDPALPAAATAPLDFSGALVSPAAAPAPWPGEQRSAFVAALATLLNQPADALAQDSLGEPLVAPPLWGRWHAAVDRLELTDGASPQWFHELNADPRLRATAGLGAEVVRRNDQELIAEAWDQVEGIVAANGALRWAQAAREASSKLLANHLAALDYDTLVQVTAPVHAHLLVDPATAGPASAPRTAAAHLQVSPIPDGATDGRVRRARRPAARRAAARARRAAAASPAGSDASSTAFPAGADAPSAASAADAPTVAFPTADSSTAAGPPGAPPAGPPQPATAAGAPAGLLSRLNDRGLRTRPVVPTPAGMVVTTLTAAVSRPGGPLPGAPAGAAARAVPPGGAGEPTQPLPGATPVPPPAAGWLPGVAGAVLDTGGAVNTPVPITTDPRDRDTVARTAALFGQAMVNLVAAADAAPAAGPVLYQADLPALASTLTAKLDPAHTITAGIRSRLRLAPWIAWAASDPLEQVMAVPEFDTPMYEPLRDLGQDWLLPGAGAVPPETVTVVLPNQRFIEAYLLGLSFEMGRELLFHEYPTDQRGTYFPQFWDTRGTLTPAGTPADPAALHDITPIPSWHADAGLGTNTGRPSPTNGELVLLVKGELLRRFPRTLVTAVTAVLGSDGLRTLGDTAAYPVFLGRLEPDIAFFGFDLTVAQARGGSGPDDLGWFFVLAEHPTEPRFGLDADNGEYAGKPTSWSDLNWAHLAPDAQALAGLDYVDLGAALPDVSAVVPAAGDPTVAWHVSGAPAGANGSDLAWITLRRPFRVAIHGADVLPEAAP